jgi:hypothetical protein
MTSQLQQSNLMVTATGLNCDDKCYQLSLASMARVCAALTENDAVGQAVGRNEAVVHGVGIVERDDLEHERRHRYQRIEAADARALLRRHHAPPLETPVAQKQRDVERHHRAQHIVKLPARQHGPRYFLLLNQSPQQLAQPQSVLSGSWTRLPIAIKACSNVKPS